MKTIKVNDYAEVPNNFTGIVEYEDEYMTKEWYKEGNLHRIDGPAVEYSDGGKEWWIEYVEYHEEDLQELIETCITLSIEKCDGGTYWIKFLCEDEIEEYPFIPGMAVDISSIVK